MSATAAAAPAPQRGKRRRGATAGNFRLLADFAPAMIWVASPDRRWVYFNRPWLEFTGRDLEAELGAAWTDGVHPDDRAGVLALYEKSFAASEPLEIEFRLRRHDGEYRWLIDKGVPLVAGGQLRGFVGSCLDITDRVREDERRAEVLARERNARSIAESATLARDQFLAIVSHELRSPLNGIKSWTHVLENQLRTSDPEIKRAIAGIMIGVEHQVRLIEDLLDVTRAMSGNLELVKRAMPLLPVLADAVEGLRATVTEKRLHLVTDYTIGDREIHGDPDRVRQIFVKLISNAVKFTQPGSTLWISARPEGAMARVEVRGDGTGIPPVALALVQRLAELHGGYVTCESDGIKRGSTFRVFLPLRRDSGARAAVGHTPFRL